MVASYEELILTCSLLIASLAFIVTVWQGVVTRRHNRLSLRPYLGFTSSVVLSEPISISIQNSGIGPGFVTKAWYLWDGEKCELSDGNDFDQMIQRTIGVHFNFDVRCNFIVGKSILLPGESALFIEVDVSNSKEQSRHVLEQLPELGIEYKCSYEKKYDSRWRKILTNNLT